MANIVVTSTATRIGVVFNDMAGPAGYSQSTFPRTSLLRVSIDSISDVVVVTMADGSHWRLGANALAVDSVDGTPTTDTASLYAAVMALI